MAGRFTLGKTERLKSRKKIRQLFSEGSILTAGQLKMFYRGTEEGLQFGAGVSTRNFRKATQRNRVKRLLRESWRLQNLSLKEMLRDKNMGLDVFIIYTGKELPQHKDVFDKTLDLLNKLQKIIG